MNARRRTVQIHMERNAAVNHSGAELILAAASELFSTEGFEAVSVASIAQRAGVSKANVFHHYASKDDLYVAVMQGAGDSSADFAAALHDMPGHSADKVQRLLDYMMRDHMANRRRVLLFMREISHAGHSRVLKIARRAFSRNLSAVTNIFAQGIARGEFRASLDPAAAAMMVGGALLSYVNCGGALSDFGEADGLPDAATYARQVAEVLLFGILAKKTTRKAHRTVAGRTARRI